MSIGPPLTRSRERMAAPCPSTVRRRWRDFAFQGFQKPDPPEEPAETLARMQQGSFAHLRHRSSGGGFVPSVFGDTCADTAWGEVRPYAPFGLMHHLSAGAGVAEPRERRGKTEQEQRGRTGLAA